MLEHLCAALLATATGTAGLTKLGGTYQEGRPHTLLSWGMRIAASPRFAAAEVACAFEVAAAPCASIRGLCALLILAAAAIGLTSSLLSGEQCRCFGAAGPKRLRTAQALQAAVILLSAINVALLWATPHCDRTEVLGAAISALVIFGVSCVVGARYRQESGSITESVSRTTPSAVWMRMQLQPEEVLGLDRTGRTCRLRDVLRAEKPLLVVGIRATCSSCERLLPDLYVFATGFGSQVPIVVIGDAKACLERFSDGNVVAALWDETRGFATRVDAGFYPFAVLVNGTTSGLMGPPALGENAVRRLFAAALNVRGGN